MTDKRIETRAFSLEVREADLLEGKVTALLAPYGQTTMDAGHPAGERFMPGSFTKTIKDRQGSKRPLLLFRSHDHKQAVGKAVHLEDTPDGPVGTFQLGLETRAGQEALAELKAGLLPEVSVGFRSILEQRGRDGARELKEAALAEVSLVPMGAYEGAQVLAVRSKGLDLSWVKLPDAPDIDPHAPLRVWG